jgi:hypothetical protein
MDVQLLLLTAAREVNDTALVCRHSLSALRCLQMVTPFDVAAVARMGIVYTSALVQLSDANATAAAQRTAAALQLAFGDDADVTLAFSKRFSRQLAK